MLGVDGYRIRIANTCNAGEFIEFIKEVMAEYRKVVMVLGNTFYHKSKAVRKFVESTDGNLELIFLPPYTPQLNPIEMQWREIKRLLSGRYFGSVDELKEAIMTLVNEQQMRPVNLMSYMVPA